MKYENIVEGKFISRPNRFIAIVDIEGREEKSHVKNTGRCKELLIPGTKVFLEDFHDKMGKRKMRYSLINIMKGDKLINMDSQAPNKVCEEALLNGQILLPDMGTLKIVQREKTYGDSRFDFYLEDIEGKRGWLEVKGVTLEKESVAYFPDAPTERGVKHINELIKAKKAGFESYILFVVQMEGIKEFRPNDITHKEFGDALRTALDVGIHILAYDCKVSESTLNINNRVFCRV